MVVLVRPEPEPAPCPDIFFTLRWVGGGEGGDKWKMAACWCSEVKDLKGFAEHVQNPGTSCR